MSRTMGTRSADRFAALAFGTATLAGAPSEALEPICDVGLPSVCCGDSSGSAVHAPFLTERRTRGRLLRCVACNPGSGPLVLAEGSASVLPYLRQIAECAADFVIGSLERNMLHV
jgi:hypothetical protein